LNRRREHRQRKRKYSPTLWEHRGEKNGKKDRNERGGQVRESGGNMVEKGQSDGTQKGMVPDEAWEREPWQQTMPESPQKKKKIENKEWKHCKGKPVPAGKTHISVCSKGHGHLVNARNRRENHLVEEHVTRDCRPE